MQPANRRFVEAVEPLGLTVDIRHFPEGTRTAEDAARAIGCDVAQIVKSLVFLADGEPVLALVSGANRLDADRLAACAGGVAITRADADGVRAATGFAIGGTPPLGHARPLRTYVDVELTTHDVVWAAAGTPDTVFAIDPSVLVELSGGVLAELSAR